MSFIYINTHYFNIYLDDVHAVSLPCEATSNSLNVDLESSFKNSPKMEPVKLRLTIGETRAKLLLLEIHH